MPELPELQAHAERLDAWLAGATLEAFTPLTFTALKTAVPAPTEAVGQELRRVGRRGKYLLLATDPVVFVVHLMQGGRLKVDLKPSTARPRGGLARWRFSAAGDSDEPRHLLLTEAGKEHRAGVWTARPADVVVDGPPLAGLGPEADQVDVDELAGRLAAGRMRLHTFLRDQRQLAGIGRRLANEVCHRARLSPFASTTSLGRDGAAAVVDAIRACVAEGLAAERARPDMSASADRPGSVHGRVGQPCPVCGDAVRSVSYASYTVAYCPTCQTGGKVLADNTTSKFLR